MVEDFGIASLETPCREEEAPVDIGFGVGDVEVGEDHAAGVQRLDGQVRGGAFAGLADLDDRNQVPGAFGAQVVAAQRLLVGADLVGVQLAVGTEQLRQNLAVAAGVGRVYHQSRIDRGDLHGGMQVRGRRAADDDRKAQRAAFQLLADVGHLVERRGDQAAQADAVGAPRHGLFDDPLRLDHHAEVLYLVSVAGHHDRHDILADVVYVAFDRGDQNLARVVRGLGAALLDVGGQGRHGALHHAGGLHDLRQKHLALAEERADPLHGGHQQGVDHGHRRSEGFVALQRVLLDVVRYALEHGVADPFGERSRAPCVGDLRLGLGRGAHLLRIFGEPFGGVGPAAEDHVLDALEQFGFDLAVYLHHLRVDDAHVHARADGVVEERRVHRFAHGVVAAEGEREVRHAARHLCVRQVFLDPARRVDKGFGVAVVFGNSRRHGQYVGVEDDVFGGESRVGQQAVGA